MDADISELYKGCRTYRRFLQKPVPEEVLRVAAENAAGRSCGRNQQVLKFYVINSKENVDKMQGLVRWAAALPKEIGTPEEGARPTAFIVITRPEGNPLAEIDLGIAADTIALTCWNSGIGSCIMFSINRPGIADIIGADSKEVGLAIALGYPSIKSTVVPVPESGSLDYYVDEDRNYYVPKKDPSDVIKYL